MIKKLVMRLMMLSLLGMINCYAGPQNSQVAKVDPELNAYDPYEVPVGASYGGGTVFCVSDTEEGIRDCSTARGAKGRYGLIMANEDQANLDSSGGGVMWSAEYLETGATSEDDGGAAANTKKIIAAHPNENPSNNAAHLVANYRAGGFADWYLPTESEINKMYKYAEDNNLIGHNCVGRVAGGVQCFIGGDSDKYKRYWSSAESATCYRLAWSQSFSDSSQNLYSKSLRVAVRALRFFNSLAAVRSYRNINIVKNEVKQKEITSANLQKILPNAPGPKKVGDLFGGGLVFCVSDTLEEIKNCSIEEGAVGKYGLIMAIEDQTDLKGVEWSADNAKTGVVYEDDGAANTKAIIKARPNDNAGNNAAWLAVNYRDPYEGYTDWYLPAKNELKKMYLYAKANRLIGEGCEGQKQKGVKCFLASRYWSSVERADSNDYAWHQHFIDGGQYNLNKYNRLAVRVVRVFNSLAEVRGNVESKSIAKDDMISQKQRYAIATNEINENSENSSNKLKVGDYYGGGTVFCVSDTQEGLKNCSILPGALGKYGLVMANNDQANVDSLDSGVTWSSTNSLTNALSMDDGVLNTQIIVAAHAQDNAANNAAYLCQSYIDKEGHNDWYLPSVGELNKMYLYAKANNLIGRNCAGKKASQIQCLLGGISDDRNLYWSSTERAGSDDVAWGQYFSNGEHGPGSYKKSKFGVRAIRVANAIARKTLISEDKLLYMVRSEILPSITLELFSLNSILTDMIADIQ